MAILMLDGGQNNHGHLLLGDDDYPDNYVNKAHPNDYQTTTMPITAEYIFHKKSHFNRLIFRISWKIAENKYVPISFICNTGCPMFLYLSSDARKAIKMRILEDDVQNEYVEINGKKTPIANSPSEHGETNIMGLMMCARLGLTINEKCEYTFANIQELF